MENTTKNKPKIEMDSKHSESEILEAGLKPMQAPKVRYILYECDTNVYFFEQVEDDLFRLYCTCSKKSYYLS